MVSPVSGRPPSARAAALEALRQVDEGEGFLRDELHGVFDRIDLEPRDRALATQLAAGAIRHRRTLRLILSHLRGDRGRETAIQPELRRVLELGAFQLLFLDRVPAYAAVNEAVEQARQGLDRRRGEKAGGFVNGMLRGLGRLIVGREADGSPAPDALPHPDGGIVRLREAVLPDPKHSIAAFLGAAYSYPDWLVAKWVGQFEEQGAEEICCWGNRRPRMFARLNPLVDAAGRLAAAGLPATLPPGPRSGSVDVSDLAMDVLEPLLAEGVLTIQDPSAMAAAEALAPAPGESVLDLCASPGTKTTQIVERMGDRGGVVACDRSEDKLDPIRRTVAARRLASVKVCLSSDADVAAPPGGFDAALVDAPCSNTGVLARRADARWRLRAEDIEDLPHTQLELVERAAGLARPGGRLVYSTCSLQREENEEVVEAFVAGHPKWRFDRSEFILPGPTCDGAFWALVRRT